MGFWFNRAFKAVVPNAEHEKNPADFFEKSPFGVFGDPPLRKGSAAGGNRFMCWIDHFPPLAPSPTIIVLLVPSAMSLILLPRNELNIPTCVSGYPLTPNALTRVCLVGSMQVFVPGNRTQTESFGPIDMM